MALGSAASHAIEITVGPQLAPIPGDVAEANVLVGMLDGSGSVSQPTGAGNARSPWTGLTNASAGDRAFLYVQSGGIAFDLDVPANGGVPAREASFLWGSPDTYNRLELFLDGDSVATIVPGSSPVPVDANGTYRVTISEVEFDALEFSSTQASFEFANLAVSPAFDGELGCRDAETEPGSTLRRLDDVGLGDDDECAPPIPSRLDFDGATLRFLADYAVLGDAEPAFAFDVAWRTEWVEGVATQQAIPYTGVNPPSVPTTAQAAPLSVQWFGASAEPEEPHLLDYCPGTPEYAVDESGKPVLDAEGNPVLVGLTFPAGFVTTANDMSSDLPGFQYGCLIRRDVEILEDTGACPELPEQAPANPICIRVRESGYLRGDWTATRTLR
jgi:hypothetical protein